MTVIKCKDCTWHYSHQLVAELFTRKEDHEKTFKTHTVEFFDTLSSALLGLGKSNIVHRAICDRCLKYYDGRTKLSVEQHVRQHQKFANENIERRKKGGHKLVRAIRPSDPNPPVGKYDYSYRYRSEERDYAFECSCGNVFYGYGEVKAEWDFERHQKEANKRLQKAIAEKGSTIHEGITFKEIPWDEYESTADTGALGREIKQWKKQMEEQHITSQEFSDVTEVVRGNDEVAFWLRSSGKNNYNEIFIAVRLNYRDCPHAHCKFDANVTQEDWVFVKEYKKEERQQRIDELNKMQKHPFQSLFEHFMNHYDPQVQGHNAFENTAYAMLQQFVILEVNRRKGRRGPDSPLGDRAAYAIHEIIKTFGIPTQLLADIIKATYAYVANHYYQGIYLSKEGVPEWVKNVTGSPCPEGS